MAFLVSSLVCKIHLWYWWNNLIRQLSERVKSLLPQHSFQKHNYITLNPADRFLHNNLALEPCIQLLEYSSRNAAKEMLTVRPTCSLYLSAGLRSLNVLWAASPPGTWAANGSRARCCTGRFGSRSRLCNQCPAKQNNGFTYREFYWATMGKAWMEPILQLPLETSTTFRRSVVFGMGRCD